jgi:ribonuclease HI
MKYPYEKELNGKAEKFCALLNKNGIDASVLKDSLREYSIKIGVKKDNSSCGYINIYYKSSKKTFRISTHEMTDIETTRKCGEIWGNDDTAHNICDYQVYVDGSYRNGIVSYGAIILKNSSEIKRMAGIVNGYAEMNQVAGEIYAAIEAIKWCESNNINEISVFYDYDGIRKWATGEWKTKNSLTKEYQKFIQGTQLKINWHKVDSHSGNFWNEETDKLAKVASEI